MFRTTQPMWAVVSRDSQSHWLAGKENAFMDPSHDTVLHSGAIGSRDAARPLYVSTDCL